MKTRVIFTYMVSGHNMEYLHHLYIGALKDETHRYVFAVPNEFEQKKRLMEWPVSDRISFHFINNPLLGKGMLAIRAWRNAKAVGDAVKLLRADEVILLSIIDYIPFLPLFMPRGVKVSGILYKIYLYFLPQMNRLQWLAEWMKYVVLTRYRSVDKVFVLNDEDSVVQLNRHWNTDKFAFLPDPYLPLNVSDLKNMRNELGIGKNKQIVLHIGSITSGKGSDRIFDMIDNSLTTDLRSYCFVFAGVIAADIREEFCCRLRNSRRKAEIILIEKFLSYQEMGSLIMTADKVVLPYRRTAQSSGIVAWCAQMQTPVYVPNEGLIGKLVDKYQIGICVKNFKDIHSIACVPPHYKSSYCDCHTVRDFYSTLLA